MQIAILILLVVLLMAVVAVGVLIWRQSRLASAAHDTALREAVAAASRETATDLRGDLAQQRNELLTAFTAQRAELARSLDATGDRLQTLTRQQFESQADLRTSLHSELGQLREENARKLEEMRLTVDEKLQGTLEKRLGESFQRVSEQLESVHKGLGEMQGLAHDVGGLKRVLTNVKSRGGWGEVQLARQLEDSLSPEQYEANVAVKPGSSERVEFAVRLPGRDADAAIYLPIDSKLPQEDYERLLEAQDAADKEATEAALKQLERVIIAQARLIGAKYIHVPHSTDFAIMYLPTEGLFAEVVRRPGLTAKLQNEHRVLVTGPTTLMSLLNSLQMGFRTLAIEKRTSEVWEVLSAAKTEFRKYGDVWDKLSKQLATAQNTVKEAGTRTRGIERKLKNVEAFQASEVHALLDEVLDEASDSAVLGDSTQHTVDEVS